MFKNVNYKSSISEDMALSLSVPELREVIKHKGPLHNLEWTLELILPVGMLKKMPNSTHILILRGVLECSYLTIIQLNKIYQEEINCKQSCK